MPTYEYECKKCGHRFEKFQNMNDAPLRKCPECAGPVRRIIHGGVGVIFKGSGFYETDYGRGSRTPRCGRNSTCCGRDEPCEKRPCND